MSVLPSLTRRLPRTPWSRWPGSERWVLWLLALVIGLLSVAPLVRLVWAAVAPQGVPDMQRLSGLLATPRVLRATGNTLMIALASTALALLLGTLAAWLVAISSMRAKSAWVFAFILPLMIPPQVTALAWVQALSPS
ncbi:MAG TPA: ABC transporter permease, partial [Erwinia persicina]|nr:ABC transporter permease [Erwinia persicina]